MTASPWLPNFFIAGVPKAGTSSLHIWIAAHPDALGSLDKETCFFADPGTHIYRSDFNASNGLDAYRQQFNLPNGTAPRVIFESTPAYIYQDTALREIPALKSRPKCLFVVREPAAQIASIHRYYRNNWSMIPANMGLATYVQALRDGCGEFKGNELVRNALTNARYWTFLRRWQQLLGRDRMKIKTFDALARDPQGFVQEIAVWLGLDPTFYDSYDFPRENESYQPRSRMIQRVNIALRGLLPKGQFYQRLRVIYRRANTRVSDETSESDRETLAALRGSFADDNTRLAEEFGLDLSGWKR